MSKSNIYTGNNHDWQKAKFQGEPRALLQYYNHLRHLRALDDEAADNEVQDIIGNKDIDRSPVRPSNPMSADILKREEDARSANDEVKQILSGRLRKSGGSSDRQKGIAAQIRTYTNSDLREELNKIVHSGDSVSAKTHHPSNEYIDLSNNHDSKADDLLQKAIDSIKNNHKLSHKQKNKILHGIVNNISKTTTTPNKNSTTRTSQVTPRRTFKDMIKTNMTTRSIPRTNRRSRSRTRTRTRTSRRNKSRRSRRSRN
jgi:hypothetical protein